MKNLDRQKHWENIYHTKQLSDVSWYQPTPTTSLEFVKRFRIRKTAKIIDVGGGDSLFVDNLLEMGFRDITVLDISEAAINRAKLRLADKASQVKWIIADATEFIPIEKYDFWHDRAAFHFLTQENEVDAYIDNIQKGLSDKGFLVIGTFSEEGPKKCSGIEIRQYSETTMTAQLAKLFKKIKCITVDHKTPFDTIQNFIFCSFKKLKLT